MRATISGLALGTCLLASCAGAERFLISSSANSETGFPPAPTQAETRRNLAAADDLIRVNPRAPEPYLARARIHLDADNRIAARKDVDTSIALKPSVEGYLLRQRIRDEAEIAGRREDLASAQKLEPKSRRVFSTGAAIERSAHEYDKALAYLEAGLALEPGEPGLLIQRGVIYAMTGQTPAALENFSKARVAISGNAAKLNDLCWAKATTGLALESALQDCNASLAIIHTSSATLDSRALVELRLGRFDKAIADYDAALKLAPNRAPSLYGRGIARLRSGQKEKGEADLTAARAISSVIDARFREYGVLP